MLEEVSKTTGKEPEAFHYNSVGSGLQKHLRNHEILSRNDEYLEKESTGERHEFKSFRRYLESKTSGNIENEPRSGINLKDGKFVTATISIASMYPVLDDKCI
ncbi:hypothetical protein TNIN_303001 [Trichonephila inaurata madagascariensis]|uniref:Uncharacterized protein n=1 Tax=Trichonephila inaurata madagascariensis TaxID=2747483 RepID=A0A8X7CE55_9ARAC|nr:hypothetical protein TNIN_303001 [Trichonephila inaurata madagascariensis]